MLFNWLLFICVAFVSKVVLAFVMIYILLPNERCCAQCDEETLLMRGGPISRFGTTLSLGRIRWRWCPRCGWEGLSRQISSESRSAGEMAPQKPKTSNWR